MQTSPPSAHVQDIAAPKGIERGSVFFQSLARAEREIEAEGLGNKSHRVDISSSDSIKGDMENGRVMLAAILSAHYFS